MEQSKIEEFFIYLFERTARENSSAVENVELCFLLKNPSEYRCLCDGRDVVISDQEIKEHFHHTFIPAFLIRRKINSFITDALLKFSKNNTIEKRCVNVMMRVDIPVSNRAFKLTLRNATDIVRSVTIDELIN